MIMTKGWNAKGLLFENCNCAVICPGHVHFSQGCTNDICIGFWGIRIDEGSIDGIDLAGVKAVVTYKSPKRMIDGGWSQMIVVDQATSPEVRDAVESIVKGERGGPWGVLARFVTERLPTLAADIRIEDLGKTKKVSIEGLLESTVEAIQGRDRSAPVTLENMFNQIHSPSQVVARGSSTFTHPGVSFINEGTHGLYSTFSWAVADK